MATENTSGYLVPARNVSHEILVQRSRFIGFISPLHDTKDAKSILARAKSLYPGANHYVHAYVVGFAPVMTTHCNDDGEPPRTAGRPVLTVLQNSGFGDISIVVIRYFGGIKLGTGGLVRAYQETTKRTLELTPLAKKQLTSLLEVSSEYQHFQAVDNCIQNKGGQILEKSFSDRAVLKVCLPFHNLASFLGETNNLTAGSIQVNIIVEQEMTVLPIT